MSIATALARFRVKQAEQFSDTATVVRPVGEPEFTGEHYSQDAVTIYTDEPCKIRPAAIGGEDQSGAGETLVSTPDSEAKFAVNSDLRIGDVVTVTASLYDAGMVGRTYRVKRVPADAWQIARVAVLEETIAPTLNEVS